MTTTIWAHFDGQAIVLDEPVDLPLHQSFKLLVEIEPPVSDVAPTPRRSLSGVIAGWGINTDDLDQARREMWDDFPRTDL